MKYKYIGAFAEGYGSGHPTLRSCISDEPISQKEKVLDYLKSGHAAAATSAKLKDYISGEDISGETIGYTDGEFAWRSDLCYYFEKYNFKLPKEFVDKALKS